MTETLDPKTLAHLQQWQGRSERHTEWIAAAPLAGLSATLDRIDDPMPEPGTPLPPLAHWLYFLPRAPQREIGEDGHPRLGGFLPPVPLPRRMWAGGRLRFEQDLRVGIEATRTSTVHKVEAKQGRSGAMAFVTVEHELATSSGVALVEEHDIVYRAAAVAGAAVAVPPQAPTDEQVRRDIVPDPVLLFRYSALTFNGHRIHYDRSYATEVEGYPGLIVHGPLIATLLVDLLRREWPELRLLRFEFTAVSPLFDIHPFSVNARREDGGKVSLWARNHEGALAMRAKAEVA